MSEEPIVIRAGRMLYALYALPPLVFVAGIVAIMSVTSICDWQDFIIVFTLLCLPIWAALLIIRNFVHPPEVWISPANLRVVRAGDQRSWSWSQIDDFRVASNGRYSWPVVEWRSADQHSDKLSFRLPRNLPLLASQVCQMLSCAKEAARPNSSDFRDKVLESLAGTTQPSLKALWPMIAVFLAGDGFIILALLMAQSRH